MKLHLHLEQNGLTSNTVILYICFNGKDTTHSRNVHNWDPEPVRLYHIKDDPHEQNNVASRHPEVIERLKASIFDWHPEARQRLPAKRHEAASWFRSHRGGA